MNRAHFGFGVALALSLSLLLPCTPFYKRHRLSHFERPTIRQMSAGEFILAVYVPRLFLLIKNRVLA
jgi:hypothetical protein